MNKENTQKPIIKSFRVTPVLNKKINECRNAIAENRNLSHSEYTLTDFINEAVDFYANFVIDDTINGPSNLAILDVIIDRKLEQNNRLTQNMLNTILNKLNDQEKSISNIENVIRESYDEQSTDYR